MIDGDLSNKIANSSSWSEWKNLIIYLLNSETQQLSELENSMLEMEKEKLISSIEINAKLDNLKSEMKQAQTRYNKIMGIVFGVGTFIGSTIGPYVLSFFNTIIKNMLEKL